MQKYSVRAPLSSQPTLLPLPHILCVKSVLMCTENAQTQKYKNTQILKVKKETVNFNAEVFFVWSLDQLPAPDISLLPLLSNVSNKDRDMWSETQRQRYEKHKHRDMWNTKADICETQRQRYEKWTHKHRDVWNTKADICATQKQRYETWTQRYVKHKSRYMWNTKTEIWEVNTQRQRYVKHKSRYIKHKTLLSRIFQVNPFVTKRSHRSPEAWKYVYDFLSPNPQRGISKGS